MIKKENELTDGWKVMIIFAFIGFWLIFITLSVMLVNWTFKASNPTYPTYQDLTDNGKEMYDAGKDSGCYDGCDAFRRLAFEKYNLSDKAKFDNDCSTICDEMGASS